MWLDDFAPAEVRRALHRCLASERWLDAMQAKLPLRSNEALYEAAFAAYATLGESDWLEAIAHHPRIGAQSTASAWSSQEQAGMSQAQAHTRAQLLALNDEYEKKFGFVYLVNATGKSADELLRRLQTRLPQTREQELLTAADELRQIMRIRLEKLLGERGAITTHVLDQALGRPAADIAVTLSLQHDDAWREIATRRTDRDGRIGHFMVPGVRPEAGVYRLRFSLEGYVGAGFFPFVDLVFRITQPDQHHHVPLLLSPFGYATYRGS